MLPKSLTLLLLPVLLLLVGCLEEDSITIKSDGAINFESMVTVPDKAEKIQFADLDKFVTTTIDELRQSNWKVVEKKWVSKKPPYQFNITGSGRLADVVGATRFYKLSVVSDKTFRLYFRVPSSGDEMGQRRVVFTAKSENGDSLVYSSEGARVTQIDAVSETNPYTIILK